MATPTGFEYFNRGQPDPYVGGVSATTGLDYFNRGQVFSAIDTVAAVSTEQTRPALIVTPPHPRRRFADRRQPIVVQGARREGVAPPPPEITRAIVLVAPPRPRGRQADRRQPCFLRGATRISPTDPRTLPAAVEVAPPPRQHAAQRIQPAIGRARRLGDTDARLTKPLTVRAPDNLARRDQRLPVRVGLGALEAVGVADERTRPATGVRAADATARWSDRRPVLLPPNGKEPGLATDRPPRPVRLAVRASTRRPVERRQPVLAHRVIETPTPPTDGTFPALLIRAADAVARWAMRVPVRFGVPARRGDTDARTAPTVALVVAPPPRQRFEDRRQPYLPAAAVEAVGTGDERTRPVRLVAPVPTKRPSDRRQPIVLPGARREPAQTRTVPSLVVVARADRRRADRRQPFLPGRSVEPSRSFRPMLVVPPPSDARQGGRRQPLLPGPRRLGDVDPRTPPLVRLVVGRVDPQRFDRRQPIIPPPERVPERATKGPWLVIGPARDKPASDRRPILLPPPRRKGDTDARSAPSVRVLVAPQPTRRRIDRGAIWAPYPVRPSRDPGTLDGVMLLDSVLDGVLAALPVLAADAGIGAVLSGNLEVTIVATIYEGDTVRVRLTGLTHDIDGPVTTGATVTVTAYRADGTVIGSGTATYVAALAAWGRTFAVPALTAPEQIRAKAEVDYAADGSHKTFQHEARVLATYP